MGQIVQEVRFALRVLRKSPAMTTVAVSMLALGIGANTSVFSVVNATLLRPLPYAHPERLVHLCEREKTSLWPVSYPDFLDWRDRSQVFERLTAYRPFTAILTVDGTAERVPVKRVSAGFLATLGIAPALGRDFTADEDRPGAAPVALVGHEFWATRLRGGASAVGSRVVVDGTAHTVVGVLPAGFRFRGEADLFLPLAPVAHGEDRANHNGTWLVGRLRPGVTLAQAQAQLDVVGAALEAQYPASNAGLRPLLEPLDEVVTGGTGRVALLLLGAVAMVLLIACGNVANLLLARAVERRRELAIRVALGASRGALLRQLLVESVVLSAAAGAAGLLLAGWSLRLATALVPEERAGHVSLDARVLTFTVLLAVATGLLFGIAPAWHASRSDVNERLKEGGRNPVGGAGQHRLRGLLVASEVALALVLLVGAGLLVRSAHGLLSVKPGFEASRLLTVRLWEDYAPLLQQATVNGKLDLPLIERALAQRRERILERVKALPGVAAAATVYPLPLSQDSTSAFFHVEGRPEPTPGTAPRANYYVVSADYFRSMAIPLRGRSFEARDDGQAPRVMIVNETLARQYWPGQSPLGRRLRFTSWPDNADWYTVVGVAGDTRHYGLDDGALPQVYMHHAQWAQAVLLAVRTVGDPLPMATAVRRAVQEVDPGQAVYDVKSMEQRLSDWMAARRMRTGLLAAFAALAMVLTAAGVYGVISYSVSQRTHEIGLRVALGARALDILKLVVGDAMRLVGLGVGAGVLAALALTRLLRSQLYGVTPTDPPTFAVLVLVLAVVSACACYWPVRRALSLDPAVALRVE